VYQFSAQKVKGDADGRIMSAPGQPNAFLVSYVVSFKVSIHADLNDHQHKYGTTSDINV